MRVRRLLWLLVLALLAGMFSWVVLAGSFSEPRAIFPIVYKPEPTATPTVPPSPPPGSMVEFRGLWVTRFDWTGDPTPSKIDEIVDASASAGFNAIFFQVRGEADAYYKPGPEPWSWRLSGTLGQDPGWDPLAHFVQRAHERGIQLHAYVNVYPVWEWDPATQRCDRVPPVTSPLHFYYLLQQEHGTTSGLLNGLQWNTAGQAHCSVYLRASPASKFADTHYLAVAQYLVNNYDIDGLHLDNIRYGGSNTSCDPVSQAASGVACFTSPPSGYASYAAWQRAQVNGTVFKFYNQVILSHPGLWLSAAVWPVYRDYWGWGYSEGYHDYYQDSKAWVQGGYIDSISPMLYSSNPSTFPTTRWQTLVADYQNDSEGRFIVPGIGSNHYDSFQEIVDRIEAARSIGTAGHAIFSYGGMKQKGYFDDLAAGPYTVPAVVPDIPWHP